MKDWDKTFIEIAEEFAEHSTCVKRQVGAVLVKDLRILSFLETMKQNFENLFFSIFLKEI